MRFPTRSDRLRIAVTRGTRLSAFACFIAMHVTGLSTPTDAARGYGLDHDVGYADELIAFDFDGASRFQNDGSADVTTQVRGNVDSVSFVSGAPGFGDALRFPSVGSQNWNEPVVATVTPNVAASLDIGNEPFGFGADIRLDRRSTGSGSDNGNNVIQRGLFSDAAQFKIQVDEETVSCRVKGKEGNVIVSDSEPIDPASWYRIGCTRQGDSVTLTVSEFDSAQGSQRKITRSGRIGPLSFENTPITIGGKSDPDGNVLVGDSDQFNGAIDNVVFGTGPTQRADDGSISRCALGPYSLAQRIGSGG